MIRSLALVALLALLLGTSCPGGFCDNDVAGSEHGFSLTVPSRFTCTGVFPNADVISQGRWLESSTGFAVSVIVSAPQSSEPDDAEGGFTTEDLGETTNDHGATLAIQKVTILNQDTSEALVTSYVAGTTLTSGNNLLISVVALTDDPALRTTLDEIVASVQVTP